MRALRLVFVTRQYWPLVGGAQVVMGDVARELHRRGAEVTILTAKWQPEWPDSLDDRGVRIIRLPQPRLRFWGTLRYMRALKAWLRQRHEAYDLVYVSMLKHDAFAALAARGDDGPAIVLRPELAGPLGDVCWQAKANFGRVIRRRCRTADALVALAPWVRDELVAAGYPREHIHEIPNGVRVQPPTSAVERIAARRDLAAAHTPLAIADDAPLAVYTGRLHESKRLIDLITAWQACREDAVLWLVGDGPERQRLARRILALELQGRVVLAGRFDNVGDFLAAADLFVLPSREELMSIALLEAMAAGLPIVASDIPANRNLIAHEAHGLLVPVANPAALAAAVERLFANRSFANQLGAAARRRVIEKYSIETVAERHEQLFRQIIDRRTH